MNAYLKEKRKKGFLVGLVFFLVSLAVFSLETARKYYEPSFQTHLMQKNQKSLIEFTRSDQSLDEEDVLYLEHELTGIGTLQKSYSYYQDGLDMTLAIPSSKASGLEIFGYRAPSFVVYRDEALPKGAELIGKAPTNEYDIVIPQYYADLILKNGIFVDEKDSPIFPKSYEDILRTESFYKIGDARVKISGILKQDLTSYQSLQDVNWDTIQYSRFHPAAIFNQDVVSFSYFFVTEDFDAYLASYANAFFHESITASLKEPSESLVSKVGVLEHGIQTKEGVLNELKENEVIVSQEVVSLLSFDQPIGQKISLKINATWADYIIKGISKDGCIYISKEAPLSYLPTAKKISNAYVVVDEEKDFEQIFRIFSSDSRPYMAKGAYTDVVESFTGATKSFIKNLDSILFVIDVVALVFLFNFLLQILWSTTDQRDKKFKKALYLRTIRFVFVATFAAIGVGFLGQIILNLWMSKTLTIAFWPLSLSIQAISKTLINAFLLWGVAFFCLVWKKEL